MGGSQLNKACKKLLLSNFFWTFASNHYLTILHAHRKVNCRHECERFWAHICCYRVSCLWRYLVTLYQWNVKRLSWAWPKIVFKRAAKSYFMYYSRVVIVLFNKVYKSVFSTYSLSKTRFPSLCVLVFRVSVSSALNFSSCSMFWIQFLLKI